MRDTTEVRTVWIWAAGAVATYLAVGIMAWDRSLIPDEVRPLVIADHSLADAMELARADIVHTPLSYLLGGLWLRAFDNDDTAAKSLALVIGSANLIVFAHFARRFTAQWKIALVLICLVYLQVGAPHNLVRMYGLAMLFSVSVLFLWDRWRLDPSWGRLTAWGLTSVFLVYIHPSGLLVVATLVPLTWLWGPRNKRPQLAFMMAAASVIAALLPWILYILPAYFDRGLVANLKALDQNSTRVLARMPFYFLSGIDPGGGSPPLRLHQSDWATALKWAALAVHVALFVLGWPLLRRSLPTRLQATDESSRAAICLLICALPTALLYCFSILIYPALHGRYLLVVVPTWIVLIVLLGSAGGRANRFVLYGLILPWLSLTSALAFITHTESSLVSDGVNLVARELRSNDLVLVNRHMPLGWQVEWEWTRRLRRDEPIYVGYMDLPPWFRKQFKTVDIESLNLDGVKRIWFFHFPGSWKRDEDAKAMLAIRGFFPIRSTAAQQYQLTLFERLGDARPAVSPENKSG